MKVHYVKTTRENVDALIAEAERSGRKVAHIELTVEEAVRLAGDLSYYGAFPFHFVPGDWFYYRSYRVEVSK